MSRHEVRGLDPGVVVAVGWDRVLGFWADVRRPSQPPLFYDATTTDDGTTSIAGVLNTLIEAEVCSRENVAEAEQWLSAGDMDDIPARLVGVRAAAEVIVHLREAAGQ